MASVYFGTSGRLEQLWFLCLCMCLSLSLVASILCRGMAEITSWPMKIEMVHYELALNSVPFSHFNVAMLMTLKKCYAKRKLEAHMGGGRS
jgi:hypothetical protein